MPSIAFGTGSVWKGHDPTQNILQAIRAGFIHIDTAQAYRTEDAVGRALKEAAVDRGGLFITTKYHPIADSEGLGPTKMLQRGLRKVSVRVLGLKTVSNSVLRWVYSTWTCT